MPGLMEQLLKKPEKPSEEELKKQRYDKNPLIKGIPNVQPENGKERFKIVLESMGASIEKYYFFIMRFLKEEPDHGLGFKVEKIKDLFGSSAGSSFHAQMGTKSSAMQQQLSNYLQQIGQLLKNLYPQIRELRIIDERIGYYDDSAKGDESAEVALKSIWIEQVEQGMNNPNSVYSLARQVGFVTLPDLFFKINVKKASEVDKAVKSVEMPTKVKEVLSKKLYAYCQWKEHTEKELKQRKSIATKMLRQHYNVIKLYMDWLRPYLRTLKQLEMRGSMYDTDLVTAFETSKMELELLATGSGKKYVPCLRIKITFVTKPELHYTQQGQKQPVHIGQTEIVIEPYALTLEQINDYKKSLEEQDIDFVASIDASMMAMKDDIVKYLRDAGEKMEGEKEEEPKKPKADYLGPVKGIGEGFKMLMPFGGEKGPSKQEVMAEEEEKIKAEKLASKLSFVLYDVFKKVNGMMSI